jgi:ribosomal protein S21
MVGVVKVNEFDQLLKQVRKLVLKAGQISSFPRDRRVTEGVVVQQIHRDEFDEAQLCGIFL